MKLLHIVFYSRFLETSSDMIGRKEEMKNRFDSILYLLYRRISHIRSITVSSAFVIAFFLFPMYIPN